MDIIVIGAGAIGSFYGARLSKINDVTLVARKEHAERISKKGLRVTGLEEKDYKLKATTEIDKIGENALILLTTKVYDSKTAMESIKKLVRKDTKILCLQNGLYSEKIVKEALGNSCTVLRAITNFGVAFLEPGVIHYNTDSYTAIEKSPFSDKLAENFSECGLNARVSGNIKEDMWKKLILNCVLNPVSAILRVENGAISDERLNPLKSLIVGECLRVAEKDGVKFESNFVELVNNALRGSKNVSSMQQDLLKGKRTEIDYLNGAVAEMGKEYGIMCPVNHALMEIIKEFESKNQIFSKI